MKKKIFLITLMVALFVCLFAISVSAENNIIKLDAEPTLAEIHANPDAYISRLDEFENGESYATYRDADSNSVVVMWDTTSTWYVFPTYYIMRSSYYGLTAGVKKLNEVIAAVDSTAFAGYTSTGGSYGQGECDQLIRIEVPTYVTTITDGHKFEGSANLKEVYFPIHTVVDEETGLEKVTAYITTITGTNLANSCSKLEYMHNSQYLPKGIINSNGFYNCHALKEFIIPESATYISGGAFYGCSSLTEITIPNSVTGIGKVAFAHCYKLVTVRFGASFNRFESPNHDFETFLYDSAIKYVYLPDNNYTFVGHATLAKNIFNQGKNVTFFFTGNAERAQALKDIFTARTANTNVSTAELVAFDPTINYEGYADSLGKNLIVYNYSECDAFYNGIHSYEANPCVEICSVCDDIKELDNPIHSLKTEIAYTQYTLDGEKHVYCTNEGCSKSDKTVAPALVTLVGFSINNDETELCISYAFNKKAIDEYNLANGVTLQYGVVSTIIDENEVLSLSNDNGNVVSNLDNTVVAPINCLYSGVDFKLSGFKDFKEGDKIDLKALNLVMCAYIYDGEFYYIGSTGDKNYCQKVASTLTFKSVESILE